MRRTVSCDRGKFLLPQIFSNDPEIAITGTTPGSPREGRKDKKKTMVQGRLIRGKTRDRMLAKVSETVSDVPRLKLPAIPMRNAPENNEERKRRRRIHCYDFSLQVQRVMPERDQARKSSTSTASSEDSDASAKRLPYVIYDQRYGERRQDETFDIRDKRNSLPLSFGILEGQRMRLLQKQQLNKQQKPYKPLEKERRKKHKGQPLIWFF